MLDNERLDSINPVSRLSPTPGAGNSHTIDQELQ